MKDPQDNPRWHVAQIGAREHYAIARALHRSGQLARLYTEAWVGSGAVRRVLQSGPAATRALAGRHHPDLADARVTSFTLRTLLDRVTGKPTADVEQAFLEHARIGQAFARRVAHAMRQRSLDAERTVYFGYNTGCLETLDMLKDKGVRTLVDQIDPGRVEQDLVLQECAKWPGWQATPGRIPEAYYRRLEAEWAAADRVVVNSQWSRDALVMQGVAAEKLRVVPLAYEPDAALGAPDTGRCVYDGPLRVLWLGSVILRKGIPYLIEAARQLDPARVTVTVAGPMGVSDRATGAAPDHVRFLGRVTRDRAVALYREHDVFVLPTISDGFAITQIEAMAHGLPVIATPRCGRVVTDGVDGRIVEAGDSAALAGAIAQMADDRDATAAMARAATETASGYHLDALVGPLMDAASD